MNAMNFNIPLYDLNGDDMPQNTTVYSMQVNGFLCPSDVRNSIEIEFEQPCNYAACSGDGLPGGFGLAASYGKPNGVMYFNSTTSMASLTDGSSQTAMVGESIIGSNSGIAPTPALAQSGGGGGPDRFGYQHFCGYLYLLPADRRPVCRPDRLSLGSPDELDRRGLSPHRLFQLLHAEFDDV